MREMMMARLLEISDGILIEYDSGEFDEKISAGSTKKVEKGLEQIAPLVTSACARMKEIWADAQAAAQIEQVQIQMGLNFEAGGSLYVAQVKGGASVSVTITLKPIR
jgi:hypothetical protein